LADDNANTENLNNVEVFIKHSPANSFIINSQPLIHIEKKRYVLIIKDITCCECQKETTKKIAKNKKKIAELEKDNVKINVDLQPIDSKRVVKYIKEQTALQDKENADGIIEETISTD
jgi:hypothetical protein